MGAGAFGKKQRWGMVAISILVLLVFSACLNPFQPENKKTPSAQGDTGGEFGGVQYGSIVINPANSLQAQTIMPDLENLDALANRLVVSFANTAPGSLVRANVDPWITGDPIGEIPYGTWDVTLTAYIGPDVIATGTTTGVVVDAASVPIIIDLIPLAGGTGTLAYTVNFPEDVADQVSVTLEPWGGGDPINLNAGPDYTVNFGTGTLAITANAIPSGAYLLRIQLTDTTATNGDGEHAPIARIVQIYGNLVSTDNPLTITLAQLRSPPEAPSNIIVEFTDENLFNVFWTDNSNTEQGFRKYQDDGFGNRQPLGTQLPAGTESVTGLSSAFEPLVDNFTLEVVAFNQFGESAPLSFTFRLLPAAQFPSFVNSANTNHPSWAAAGNPGSINWNTMLVGGGSAVNLYARPEDISDVRTLSTPEAIPLNPPFSLSGLGTLNPLTTYNWRVENVGDVGNAGRVVYPVREFTVRDGTLHVAAGADGGAAGSDVDPIGSVQAAVDLAEPGEMLQIGAGNYLESIVVDKQLNIVGSEATTTTVIAPDNANQTTMNIQQPVSISGLRIVAGGTGLRRGLLVNANTTIEDSEISGGTATEAVDEARAIEVNGAADLTVLRSELWAAESNSITSAAAVYAPGNYTGSMNIGSALATDGNLFRSSVAGAGRLNHIFTLNGTGTGALVARHNTFEFSTAVGSNLAPDVQGSIVFRLSNGSAVVSDNTVYGNQDQVANAGTIPAIRVGVATAQVANNAIEMIADHESIAVGIYVDSNASLTPAMIERNKIYLMTPSTGAAKTGIFADRSATIYNNVVVQGGNANSTAGFRGIELRAAGSSVIHNTVVNENGNNQNSSLLSVGSGTGANHIISNNILVGAGAAGERAINYLDGTNEPTEINANVIFGSPTDVFLTGLGNLDIFAFNAALPYAAGNFGIDPQLDSLASIQDNGWYAPVVPLETGTPAAVRSLVLAGGATDHMVSVNQDINGVARTGTISIGAHQVSGTTVIGAVGPAGGIVFHENADFNLPGETWRFMEAWVADEAQTFQWQVASELVGTTSRLVGQGFSNTYSAMEGNQHPAATAIRNAVYGGRADWFWPSRDELTLMYAQRNLIGGFENTWYWSSTEENAGNAWFRIFGATENENFRFKTNQDRVRAARMF